jgi:solute carrier family 39 (zinc transporter), member 1/2/3
MRRLSPRHTKGFLTLSLFLLAETVSFANAVSLWNRLQHNRNQFQHDDSSCDNDKDPKADALARQLPLLVRPKSKSIQLSRPRTLMDSIVRRDDCDEDDVCRKCSHCWEPAKTPTAKTKSMSNNNCYLDGTSSGTRMPRGGHSSMAFTPGVGIDLATGATTTAVTPYNIPLHGWKILFQAFLTAINVICWYLPLKSKKISAENKLALSLANAFSGGVFLSLAFGHLIPECVRGFQSSSSSSANTWPEQAPYLLVLAGYMLIFFVEKVAFDAHEIMHEMKQGGTMAATGRNNSTHNGQQQLQRNHHHSRDTNPSTPLPAAKSSGRSAVILLGALAVHSVLEMMALGLADSFADCALLTVSISLHQPAESIALLVAFLKSGMPEADIIRYLSVFSCMGPVGVALGMVVNEFAAPIVDAAMLAIVAGTFVYVGATEVIPEEWEDGTHKWAKFAALSSGIVSILIITHYTMALGGH